MPKKAQSSAVRMDRNALLIERLRIDDQVTIGYVTSLPEAKRLDGVVNALTLGARSLAYATGRWSGDEITRQIREAATSAKTLLTTLGQTTQDGIARTVKHYMSPDGALPKAIASQLDRLEHDLEEMLDPDDAQSLAQRIRGAVVDAVKTTVDGVAQQLDPSNPKSAIGQLSTKFDDGLRQVNEHLTKLRELEAARNAAAGQRARATAKGFDFEDAIEQALAPLCGPRRDLLTRVAHKPGDKRAKTGDFVVDVDSQVARGAAVRIVVETKSDTTTPSQLRAELNAAMANRGAQFAIGVSCHPQFFASGASWVQLVDDDKILVYTPYDAAASSVESLPLEVGLEMARFKVLLARHGDEHEPTLDLAQLTSYADNALNTLQRFTALKSKMTTIKTQADDVVAFAETIRADVHGALVKLKSALVSAGDAEVGHPGTRASSNAA